MKRSVFLRSLIFVCLIANHMAFGQSDGKPKAGRDVKKACPFSILGMWKSDAMSESNSIIYSFAPNGWVTLLGPTPDTLPDDFEMITEVSYSLDKPAAPKQIEFTAARGNDTFQKGITSMEITDYSDNSFTTLDPASGQKTRWERVQTRLYFLTFAARNATPPLGGPALAMWTVLDGRKTEIEALGVQLNKDDAGKAIPVFGPIEAELYNQLTVESDKDKKGEKDENVFVRIELTQAEFEATHNIYQAWDKYVKTHALPNSDPYVNALDFLKRVAESFDQCGEKVKLQSLTQRERDETVSKHNPPRRPLEYIRAMRKKNDELHVNNRSFPWGWRPMLQLQGQ
jgi:hypothetical protein